ncbi:hypothetical protein [Roseivirga sp. E12]|uniref:hypothetical protein n=1 Tax=Roseivirga sp. E12 TaxID=2819237 RepID=UPI001ABC0FE3|nr:hypothetical protein [Roseivirga sp. E12]MBO3700062.1 hypothetical protein [Roseivirga sp. E12]
MKTKLLYSLLALALIVSACGSDGGGDDQPDPCAVAVAIAISNNTNAASGQSDGSFTASATGGSGTFEYSIDGNTFQSSGTFTGLAAGQYTVTARTSQGCSGTTQVTIVDSPASVPSFANDIAPIFTARCATSGCHVDGGNAPFAINGFGDVQPRAAAIRNRVAGRTMPPGGSPALSDAQITSILAWVDGGAPNN